jgi:hypothetical protein
MANRKNFTQPSLFPLAGQNLNIVPHPKKHEISLAQRTSQSDIPTLYHGSPVSMAPGTNLRLGGKYSKQWNYATTDPVTAGRYARGRDTLNGDNGQGTLWSVIHKVEPTPGKEVFRDASSHGARTSAFVTKQFRVAEPTHLVDNLTGKTTPLGNNAPIERIPRDKPNTAHQPEIEGLEHDEPEM